ncbi:hypothetical protein GJ496_008370 [Pomphorhynchus laevis]|nr:hypothetical protein GJ496_008370 [Pomphorhynchus laevis]
MFSHKHNSINHAILPPWMKGGNTVLLDEEISWKNRSFRQKEINVSIRKIARFPKADKDTQEQNQPVEYASQFKELCINGPADLIDNSELNQNTQNLPEINPNNE